MTARELYDLLGDLSCRDDAEVVIVPNDKSVPLVTPIEIDYLDFQSMVNQVEIVVKLRDGK